MSDKEQPSAKITVENSEDVSELVRLFSAETEKPCIWIITGATYEQEGNTGYSRD